MRNYRFLRNEAPDTNGAGSPGGESTPAEGFQMPENLAATFGRFGIDPNEVNPDTFFEQIAQSELGAKHLASHQKPADSSDFMKPFKDAFDFDESINTPEALAQLLYDKLPGDDESETTEEDRNEFAEKYRELELRAEELQKQTETVPELIEKAKAEARFETLTGYKISESILQNPALSEQARANAGLVKDGVMQYLKGKGIELQAGENGTINLINSKGMPDYKPNSQERADLSYHVNTYLTEKKWLNESPTQGSGSLRPMDTGGKAKAQAVPTSLLWSANRN